MLKKFFIGVIVAFIVIEVFNFLLHGLILGGLYKQYSTLWRPDMNRLMWVMYLTTFLQTIGFVYIYYKLIGNKSPFRGIWYGLTFGFVVGIGMGYGTYAMMPIPYVMAVSWFLGSIAIYGVTGWIIGFIIKE